MNREKRDPLARRKERHVPPGARSRAMHAMSARAAMGRFVLQGCVDCGEVTYPPRDACPRCWGELQWTDRDRGARVLSETTIRISTDLYFRGQLPWRMGKVELDAGPVALAHLHAGLKVGERAEMRLMLDRGGNAALFALPVGREPDMDDRQWREFVVPVKDRTILVSDARSAIGRAVVHALHAAGAGHIVAGLAPPARVADQSDGVSGLTRVQPVPLDLTDPVMVAECMSKIAGPLDIVINTARLVRGGGVSADGNLVEQRRMLDIAVLGFMRLAQASAPLLQGRPSGAFVDVLSAQALAGDSNFAGYAAGEAARHSLLQSFRHEMRAVGVRVLSVFTGPSDDEDHQSVPPPKVAPLRLARAIIEALEAGREVSCVGDVAVDAMDRWAADPALYMREKNL
ncbi:oxidoreductase, short chain dehydrogenase/reductase family [Nitrospirillum viridazoti Y2]|uniref:NADP-dependent 3-hydroxy acid dehydrogenase YdfG n=1 Tax=Nitrospirillum amazonense TaxID=28077 RepID=A0A560J0S8_9PROT|nr:SDR family NAD(P)-dependent oxidoreductase [Nitrospirillum amazonense]EGY02394.1 oxidoreductase, short chain dehydrogenase/reductase family [Nitrospirillum amazonense Y2]TWB64365.1 NADP-dependent 3-hydroxy acid dehydrogenase YdfG [Nitrospirillum amazonense]